MTEASEIQDQQRRLVYRDLRVIMRDLRRDVRFHLQYGESNPEGRSHDRALNHAYRMIRRLRQTYPENTPSMDAMYALVGSVYAVAWRMGTGQSTPTIFDERVRHNGRSICPNCSVDISHEMLLYNHSVDGYRCVLCTPEGEDYSINRYDSTCTYTYDEDEDEESERCLFGYGSDPIQTTGKPYLAMPGETVTDTTRLFGCEIEFVAKDEHVLRKIVRNSDCTSIGVFKEDGSVPYPGGEFCLVPMTMKGAANHLKTPLNFMVESGARAWNRPACGLHIHVTRASATWSTWGKVDRFFSNADNDLFLNEVAGRSANGYCHRDLHGNPQAVPVKGARGKALGGANRYVALNFATGHPTVEFRLFRGNVAYSGVMRAIEFCDAIINFAAEQSNRSNMTHQDFKNWLAHRARSYPSLVRYLMRRAKHEDTETVEYAA